MKILIGVTRRHIGEGFRDKDYVDQVDILAKGEKDVFELSKKLKSFKKALLKVPNEEGELFCEVMSWYRQNEKQVALHKKFGKEICNIAYNYRILMVTEAELI